MQLHANSLAWFLYFVYERLGHAVVQLVEILRYKTDGRGFDSQWGHWDFSLP